MSLYLIIYVFFDEICLNGIGLYKVMYEHAWGRIQHMFCGWRLFRKGRRLTASLGRVLESSLSLSETARHINCTPFWLAGQGLVNAGRLSGGKTGTLG